jgi:multidrug resistance protein MdtO
VVIHGDASTARGAVSVNPALPPETQQTLWEWLPTFLRHELAPYPGRWSLVARMVVAATLSMIVIVTFRIPYGAIGVNCAFILSRENLIATAKSGFYFILAFAVWAAFIPIGARMFASEPMTHFLWEGVNAFLCFFLLKTLTNFTLASGVVVVATATMAIWYLPGPAEINIELTLWQILATAIGALITLLVEVVFHSWSPGDALKDGIDDRLRSIEEMLHAYGTGGAVANSIKEMLTQYAVTGAGMLRERIARNHSVPQQRMKINAVVSLLGRGVDISAALVSSLEELAPPARGQAEALAMRIAAIRGDIRTGALVVEATKANVAEDLPPLFSELLTTIGLIERVLTTCHMTDRRLGMLDEADAKTRIFVKDAFTSPEYLKYALAGTSAAMLCYVMYVALDWPGISTAVTTCVLTALSNIGSSRQKQMLRIVGVLIGGFVLGIGSQVFVLPYIDSIAGLTILFAIVTAVSAYVATSSPRLSYVGLQMAFAYYLINVTDFSISVDLTIGRDRAVGVLLGTSAMWLVFERVYLRSAAIEMVAGFARAARLIADLTSTHDRKSGSTEIDRIRSVRTTAAGLFSSINAEADAVPFESGDRRPSYLAARNRIRRWLSTLRTVYLLELSLVQSRFDYESERSVSGHKKSDERFCEALTVALNHIAKCLETQLAVAACDRPNQGMTLDTRPAPGHNRSLATLMQDDNLSPSLSLLADLVDELERDVLSEPVFAP